MPIRTMINLWPLFIGLALIGLAVGVQNSLLGIRAELEGFDDFLIALLMSCYFAGLYDRLTANTCADSSESDISAYLPPSRQWPR